MLKDEPPIRTEPSAPPPWRDFAVTCGVLLVALACSIVVIAAPRPVQPSRLPALRVPLAEGQRAFSASELATALPQQPWFSRWYELYREIGLNEREPALDPVVVADEKNQLGQLVREQFPKLGPRGVRTLMDALTARALEALPSNRPPTEAYGLLGGFPALLLQYGYIADTRSPIAPPRAIEVLYRQRFNLICERPLDTDIDDSDRLIAEGWIALHGQDLPPERRVQAAQTFAKLGGIDAREALAVWLYHGELRAEATALLQREYERTGALRLRNMLLFLQRGS